VDYFCPHYRRALFEELARRMEMDFYFFSDARDKWWNSRLPTIEDGDFRRIALRRYRVAGEPFVPALPLRLRPDRYDAVIKNLSGRLMLPSLYGAARLRRVPFVLWTGMWFHPQTTFHRLSRPATEALYRDVPAIVVYGEHVKRVLLQVPGVDSEKIFVAGQAVDASRFEAVRPAGNGRPVVLFIGQFEERKGIDDLLAAFEKVTDPDAELRLVGNGSLEEHIRRRINGHSRVTIVGHVAQDDLPAELERATCLVLPSVTTRETNEPWGLVVNEAMHAGLPVVATDAVGAAVGGLVRDGHNGYVVPERNPGRLGDAVQRLLGDRDAATRMGRQARLDAAEFNYDRMADAFEGAVEYAVEHGWT
jgi:glycosyltransferase involved in cell wall biosynthesis